MSEKEENKKLLLDYVTRCNLMGVDAYVDNAWLIDAVGDELWLDYTDFWVNKDVCPNNSYHMLFYDWKDSLDLSSDKWLKVPDGVTRIRGGAFHKNNLVKEHIKLDLNDLNELDYNQFQDIHWIEHLRGNNVKVFYPSSISNMNYLKVLELESIDSHDLTTEYFYGIPDTCKVYLYDIQTTVKKLKQILYRYKMYKILDIKGKLGIF